MTKTILITRDRSQSAELIAHLTNFGFIVISEPIFEVQKLPVKIIKTGISAAIITSANACEAVIQSQIPFDTKIFAVGKKTAEKLIELGYKNVTFPKAQNAKSLKDLILKTIKKADGKILFFHGEEITLDFKQELENEGFEAEKILAYKINWHGNFSQEFLDKIKKTNIDYVLFYSKNNAKKFYELSKSNNLLEYFSDSKLLSISEEVADILKTFGFKNCSDFREIEPLKKFYE